VHLVGFIIRIHHDAGHLNVKFIGSGVKMTERHLSLGFSRLGLKPPLLDCSDFT